MPAGGLEELLCAYPWPCAWAVATVMCESSGNPAAVNWPYVGLWQVDVELHRWTYEQLLNPEINTAAAYELWQRRGAAPWPVCGR